MGKRKNTLTLLSFTRALSRSISRNDVLSDVSCVLRNLLHASAYEMMHNFGACLLFTFSGYYTYNLLSGRIPRRPQFGTILCVERLDAKGGGLGQQVLETEVN